LFYLPSFIPNLLLIIVFVLAVAHHIQIFCESICSSRDIKYKPALRQGLKVKVFYYKLIAELPTINKSRLFYVF